MTDETVAMTTDKYEHPEVLLHIPAYYDAGGERPRKWKDRFCTTVATSATGLIRYLTWPGDKQGVDWRTRVSRPPATELGAFMLYKPDPEATARLRAEMEKMDPAGRFAPAPEGKRWVSAKSDREFAAGLRAAIRKAAGL